MNDDTSHDAQVDADAMSVSEDPVASVFDPAAFEQQTYDEANATEWTPIPAGNYGPAFIKDWKVNMVEVPDEESGGTREIPSMVVYWLVSDDELARRLEVDELVIRDQFWLDTSGNRIVFGKNKNVVLGKVRQAVGQNRAGTPWSPAQLRGAGPCTISTTLKPSKKSGAAPYVNVTARVPYRA